MGTNHYDYPSNFGWECPNCGANTSGYADDPEDDYRCSCSHDVREQLTEDDAQPGAVRETAYGVIVRTPGVDWFLTEDEALDVAARMTFTVHRRITRPWSNHDPSTVLSRGLRHESGAEED